MPQILEPTTTDVADEDINAFFAFEDLWAVIVWNDDVTTFQTVIRAFVEIFGHTVERADQLAWKIHRTGKAVAAVRPKDEAEAAVQALHRRGISATLAAPERAHRRRQTRPTRRHGARVPRRAAPSRPATRLPRWRSGLRCEPCRRRRAGPRA